MAFLLNGEHISNERLYREFLVLSGGRTPDQLRGDANTSLQQVQEAAERNVLRSALLLQFARQERLKVTPQEVEEMRRLAWGSTANQSCGTGIANDMTERALLLKAEHHATRHVQRPSVRELETIYREHAERFRKPETWLVSHIVKLAESGAEREAARNILREAAGELARGKPFAAVAERYSDCKGNGGSLGWILRESMVPEFEAKIFALTLRKPSEPFETVFGLHIAVVWEHKHEGVPPFAEVRAQLARDVLENRRQTMLHRTVEALYRSADVQLVREPERNIASGERMP